ncbi:MAG: hypothetical protein ACUVV6_05580 [Thermoplasmatota archaeon]
MRGLALASLGALLLLLLPTPSTPQSTTGVEFDVVWERSYFFELVGREMIANLTLNSYLPTTADFTVEVSGPGLNVTPATRNITLSSGGRLVLNVSAFAPAPGEYFLTAVMRRGETVSRHLAAAVFLHPLSCKFELPCESGRTAMLGVGQTFVAVVNFTNWGAAPLSPTVTLQARELADAPPGEDPTRPVTLEVGTIAPGATARFSFNGSSLPSIGTRLVQPIVRVGETTLLYGYDVGPLGAYNVSRLEFTLAARELLGVRLSSDTFELGRATTVTVYFESRMARPVLDGAVRVSLRTDIEAMGELSDYPAEERFEEFVGLVRSRVEWDGSVALGPMKPGVQVARELHLRPMMCRGSESGGSFFLDFTGSLDGTVTRTSMPFSVASPLSLELESAEKVSYAETGELLSRRVVIRNLSNQTIEGARARFYLDFRERGLVEKAKIAETPQTAVPALAPGSEARLSLTVHPLAPGTYVLFPIVEWGEVAVYGSSIRVAASASPQTPVVPYATALVVALAPLALTRRLTPG